ncbi:MAG TPA: hypothetical protein PLU72_11550 [Candidatus Ozemobacteraceae bacterium]|nr:hypothetical protein [Candidatus Ozemobacteraceae bacterium]
MSRDTDRMLRRGATFVEILVGAAIFAVIMGIVGSWFFAQKRQQEQFLRITESQDRMQQALWKIIQEVKTGRQIIWPRLNADKSPRTDSRMVFKNFRGEIAAYYYVPSAREIRRCLIPNGPGLPVVDPTPIGRGIDGASFTVMAVDNKLISVNLSANRLHFVDAVRLVNE